MNKRMILRMTTDLKVIKALWNYNRIMRRDKNYSLTKGIKMGMEILRDEKIVFHDGRYVICTFMPPFPSTAFDNHMNAVMDKKSIFTDQIYSRRSAPISFHVALTHRCMYNCLYCSARGRGINGELTVEEWGNTFRDMQDMGTSVIGITGVGLTIEKARKLKGSGLFGVGISIDTVNEIKHNEIRGNENAYDIAIQGIKNSLNAGLYTMVQSVALERDLEKEKLHKLFELAKNLKVHEVKILEPIMSGELMNENIEEGRFYTKESRKKLIDIGLKANRNGKFSRTTIFAYTESKERYGCGAGTQHSYITAQGDLFPCDFVPTKFGNVKEEPIKDI